MQDSGVESGRERSRPALITPWIVGVLSTVVVTYGMAALIFKWSPTPAEAINFKDFRDTIWQPVRYLLDGGIPYDFTAWSEAFPDNQAFLLYSPHSLLASLPFALLPWSTAATVWIGFLAASLGVTAGVAISVSGWSLTWKRISAIGAFLVLTVPGRSGLAVGQMGVLTASGAAWAIAARPVWLAATGVTVAWLKPTVGIPLFFVLLVLGRWRPAIAGTAAAIVLSIPVTVVLVHRAGGVGRFTDIVVSNLSGSATSIDGVQPGKPWSTDLPSALLRDGLALGQLGRALLMIALLVGSLAILRLVHLRLPSTPWELSCAAAASLSAFPLFTYSLPVALVGFLPLLHQAWHKRGTREVTGAVAWSALFLSGPSSLDRLGLPQIAHYSSSILILVILALGLTAALRSPRSFTAGTTIGLPQRNMARTAAQTGIDPASRRSEGTA